MNYAKNYKEGDVHCFPIRCTVCNALYVTVDEIRKSGAISDTVGDQSEETILPPRHEGRCAVRRLPQVPSRYTHRYAWYTSCKQQFYASEHARLQPFLLRRFEQRRVKVTIHVNISFKLNFICRLSFTELDTLVLFVFLRISLW